MVNVKPNGSAFWRNTKQEVNYEPHRKQTFLIRAKSSSGIGEKMSSFYNSNEGGIELYWLKKRKSWRVGEPFFKHLHKKSQVKILNY